MTLRIKFMHNNRASLVVVRNINAVFGPIKYIHVCTRQNYSESRVWPSGQTRTPRRYFGPTKLTKIDLKLRSKKWNRYGANINCHRDGRGLFRCLLGRAGSHVPGPSEGASEFFNKANFSLHQLLIQRSAEGSWRDWLHCENSPSGAERTLCFQKANGRCAASNC